MTAVVSARRYRVVDVDTGERPGGRWRTNIQTAFANGYERVRAGDCVDFVVVDDEGRVVPRPAWVAAP